LTNAIDAIAGPGEIGLRCYNEDGLAVVEVRDTGCGMPAEVRNRLFEPFFTTKGEAGTGLGLSVTHGILRRHDAEIQLDSAPGKGTTFRVLFSPVAAAPRPSAAVAGDSLRVLVVDDDLAVGELMRDLLLELGHRVTLTHNAAQALTALAQHGADLLLTDLDLDETSGWQLARQARRQHPDLLIGMVTGWPLGASAAEIKSRGVDFVLAKPFSISTLVETLASLRR
jgi:CheY-like chemotaxis protein